MHAATDLANISADDTLLDVIGADGQPADPLGRLLSTWRAAVHADPLPELASVDHARFIIMNAADRYPDPKREGTGAAAWALAACTVAVITTAILLWKGVIPW